jgi:SNF2 family DNA or RNA helicase
VFNNFSWTSGDNEQAEDRIYRLSQTKDCIVYYQLFKDTFYEKMFEKVKQKEDIINKVIVKETDK